eukprot:2181885-Rhodomonas_salina.1
MCARAGSSTDGADAALGSERVATREERQWHGLRSLCLSRPPRSASGPSSGTRRSPCRQPILVPRGLPAFDTAQVKETREDGMPRCVEGCAPRIPYRVPTGRRTRRSAITDTQGKHRLGTAATEHEQRLRSLATSEPRPDSDA